MAELILEAKRRALGDDTPADILELIEQKLAPRPRDERAEPDAAAAPPATALQALERSAEQAVSVNGE